MVYGSPRSWNKTFARAIVSTGLTPILSNPCLYVYGGSDPFVVPSAYVDDVLLLGAQLLEVKKVQMQLMNIFSMSDLGTASLVLGVSEIDQQPKCIEVSAFASQLRPVSARQARLSSCRLCSDAGCRQTTIESQEVRNISIKPKPKRTKISWVHFSYHMYLLSDGTLVYVVMILTRDMPAHTDLHVIGAKHLCAINGGLRISLYHPSSRRQATNRPLG